MKLKSSEKILMLLFVASVIIALVFDQLKERTYNLENIARVVQEVYLDQQEDSDEIIYEIHDKFLKEGEKLLTNQQWIKNHNDLYEEKSRVVVISKGDSIHFLSHNSLPVTHNQLPQYGNGVVDLANGWYDIHTMSSGDITIWLYTLIKREYRYKNKFLNTSFERNYSIPPFVLIDDDSAAEGIAIYNTEGDYAFTVNINPATNLSYDDQFLKGVSQLSAIIALSVLITLLFLLWSGRFNKGHPVSGITGFFISLLVLRFVMFFFHQPFIFYEGELFTAHHFASSYWLPSLGDLFFNVIFATLFSYFLFFKLERFPYTYKHSTLFNRTISAVLVALLAFLAFVVMRTLYGLVINSSLHLNVQFIFDPDIFHIIGFMILTGIFLFYYFISITILRYIHVSILLNIAGKKFFIAVVAIISIAFIFLLEENFLLWFLIFSASLFSLSNRKNFTGTFSFSRLLFSFLIFALIATYGLHLVNQKKELATRQNVALRIASEQDPIAEFLFSEVESDIFDDYQLTQLILTEPFNEQIILEYLKSEYFSDFWNKYDIQVTVCQPGELLILNSAEAAVVCDDFFLSYAQDFGKPTLSNRFHYLDNNTGRNSYLAIFPIQREKNGPYEFKLYIEFESKFIPKELGFPELLVDEQINITRNLGNYSYAIYKNDLMTNKYGSYFYNINVDSYQIDSIAPFVNFDADGYNHLLYNRDKDTRIIVSRPRQTLLEKIAPFSYLFIFFLVYALITWLIINYLNRGWNFSFNFKNRLQASILGIVLISVVAIGSASAWFIFNIYKNKNEAFVNEKAHSVLIEIENNLAQEDFIDETYSEFLNHMLLSLSNVFFTDINIFTTEGTLLSSSRQKVFEEGLISPVMDPVALNKLKVNGKSLYIHNEKIGNLEYISAYIQIRNINGELLAYVNLPYFAQQSELRNEISYFLVAFINIYLLLLLLSVVIAYFISNHVTKPLQVIRDSFSRLSIVKTNEKINWNRNDEIGQLIAEYNRMISELEISADLLAKSERESAWREMAKQVAHEIKNPLTPMRLNVQYLQRAWNDKVDDWDERLERFTKTMVEQIDNLNIIAGEFSDFAKMPAAKNDVIDLDEFIPGIPDLYKGDDKVEVSCYIKAHRKPLHIYADRKQLLRVFNNLIKNAIQAYSRNDVARILINCHAEGVYCVIEIKDFGEGIADDLKQNIFQPYFTTKTAGMGLGLAMVKSIIQSFNGHISFESEPGIGTSFIIRLPLIR